ncbi:hypothetical protein AB205_0152950, partial [Aquarana catesbeiana]
MNVSEGHWAQEDLEFLAVQEWELDIIYRQLLDSAQQQGGAPFAWDYQEIPVDNSKILAEESAQPDEGMEKEATSSPPQWQLHSLGGEEFSLLLQRLAEADDVESPAEVLVTGQSATKLCPAMATTVEFQRAGAVGSSLQPRITECMDLMDCSEDVIDCASPAQVLAAGQSTADPCSTPVAVSEAR